MNNRILLPALAVLVVGPAAAQHFDGSANGTVKGSYFVREVMVAGQNSAGQISSALSAMGTVTFDGQGNYSFTGQGSSSTGKTGVALSATGVYRAAANGMFAMTSLLSSDIAYGGLSAMGPSAFVASATEGTNVDILVGIPASTAVTNASLKGGYSAAYIDFLNADINSVRQATFPATADGTGGLGNLTVSGKTANTGGAATAQTVPGVSYALTANGSGTANFGAAASTQLISGTKNLYVSNDGSIVIGGSPTGFDLLVAIKSFTGTATNATLSGNYYLAGLEESIGQGGPAIDGFYGSTNATGTGTAITHNRFQSFGQPVFDYTFSNSYAVTAAGTISPTSVPYQYTLGSNGTAFLATGTGNLYSLVIGLGTPKYTGSGVFLNPLGVVNAASYAPITNPIAPNEIVTLFGTGLAGSTTSATALPLPTTLGSVQVTVNGTAAPLYYVSPTQISFLVPSAITPANGIFYATVAVVNNGTPSNSVTVYTGNTSPGVFTLGANGNGSAAAQHSGYVLVSSSYPASAGETIMLYVGGLGAVNLTPADGAAAPTTSLSRVYGPVSVNIGGEPANVVFAGLTPGTAGLYQINATLPAGIPSGAVFVDISTADGYTSEASLNVSGTGNARPGASPDVKTRRMPTDASAPKLLGIPGRAAFGE